MSGHTDMQLTKPVVSVRAVTSNTDSVWHSRAIGARESRSMGDAVMIGKARDSRHLYGRVPYPNCPSGQRLKGDTRYVRSNGSPGAERTLKV